MGRPTVLTPAEMAKFKAFIGTIKNPPNPYRLINNGLPAGLFNGGNPINGSSLYNTAPIDGGAITCVQCHALPTGTNGQLTSAAALQETQSMKIPQLRNMYRKTGFSKTSSSNNRGFGFSHDGSVDTLFSFLQLPVFQFPSGATGTQQRLDIEAFLFCFSIDTHAAVGSQSTLVSLGGAVPSQVSLLDTFESLAASNAVGLVVKGSVGGLQRGYAYAGSGVFQTDRRNETVSSAALRALAAPGSELTYTIVPAGSQTRIGVDRDLDTFFDRDEVIAGSNPADPNSVPPPPCVGDINGDRIINTADLTILLANFGQAVPAGTLGDFDGNATVNTADLTTFLAAFGTACP